MTELGASVKLARVRFGVIERLRADQERTSKKTLEEKEALRVKFEGLEATLKADRAAKKELARERAILEKTNAELEKEKVELQAERDVVAQKLIEKRKRLRDSRGQEVSRERVRVQSAMTDKLSRRLDRVRTYLAQRGLSEREKNLLGQASGTRKCLEMIQEEKLEITQELIDIFIQQEAEHQAEVAKLDVGPLPEEDLALSPLVLQSRFVNEDFMATLDPYGSNDDLVGSESASQLQTPRVALGGVSAGQSGENPADAAPSCKKADLHVGDETVEEGDSLVREDLPKDADSAKVIEVHDPSPDEEEENDDAEESPSPLLVETREPSREQKKSGLAEKSSSPVSIGQEKSREWNEGEEQAISTDVLESLTTPEGGEVAKDPEADLPTAPVEDPSAPKELPA
ncbi:hypothetical protein Bca4012_084078 [Brassica carinata]